MYSRSDAHGYFFTSRATANNNKMKYKALKGRFHPKWTRGNKRQRRPGRSYYIRWYRNKDGSQKYQSYKQSIQSRWS